MNIYQNIFFYKKKDMRGRANPYNNYYYYKKKGNFNVNRNRADNNRINNSKKSLGTNKMEIENDNQDEDGYKEIIDQKAQKVKENKLDDLGKQNSNISSNKNNKDELIDKKIYDTLKKEKESLEIKLKQNESKYLSEIERIKKEFNEIIKLKTEQYNKEIKEKEEENKTLQFNLGNFTDIKYEIKNKEKIIKELNNQKIELEKKIKEKECDIKNLKVALEKNINESNNIRTENKLFLDDNNKLKIKIKELGNGNSKLMKSLEEEKNKNLTYNNIIKNKEEEILFLQNKFNLIKDILIDIKKRNEDKKANNKMTVESKTKEVEEEEKEEEEEEEEEGYESITNKNNGKIGLDNEELNCYMSSVIQILKNIKAFSSLILKIDKKDDDIIVSLQNLIKSLYYSKKKSVSLIEFKKHFSQVYKKFEGKKDNDSTFFLIYLFQYLQKILLKSGRRVTNLSEFSHLNLKSEEKKELAKFLEVYEPKNYSDLNDLFFGYQMSEIICSACNNLEITFQSFNILHLSLYDGTTKLDSLEQCINSFLFTKDKKGSENFDCTKCHRKCLSHVISLVKLPPILIINLKRVGEKYIYIHDISIPFILNTNTIEKLEKFDMEYELIGYIKHFGSDKSGHNIAYAKNIFDKKWYCFNDDEVKEESISNNSTKGSFLLFYQLKK